MISSAQVQSIIDLREKFSQLIIPHPTIRSESFEKNDFFRIILNGLDELLQYITLILALRKYIENEDINEDVDNIIATLNELYNKYQKEKDSNLFDIIAFSRNHVRGMSHLPDEIEKVYKTLLERAQLDIMNVLT
jgi:hypothetical protein